MNVLVFAPHADDEILGVGGTIAKHVLNKDNVYICIATRPYPPVFDEGLFDIIRKETLLAHEYLGVTKTFFLELPAVNVESVPRTELNKNVLDVINEVSPEIVYMPHFGDMQKDHTLIAESVLVATRPRGNNPMKKVLSYETLSETEWNIPHASNAFIPNVYNDITDTIEAKTKAMSFFASQLQPSPFPRSLSAIKALAAFRGSTICCDYAESFMLVREVIK